MAKKKQKHPARRIGKEEISKRVLALESVYGSATAQILGVSKSTVSAWRAGKRAPGKQATYEKLNRVYTSKRKQITPEKLEARSRAYERRRKAATVGGKRERHIAIFPDYMEVVREAFEPDGIEQLIELDEQGYEGAYIGGKETPMPLQFVIHGTSLSEEENRTGTLIVVALTIRKMSTAQRKKANMNVPYGAPSMQFFTIKPLEQKHGMKLLPSDDYETRTEKIRNFMESNTTNTLDNRVYFAQLVGWYYE